MFSNIGVYRNKWFKLNGCLTLLLDSVIVMHARSLGFEPGVVTASPVTMN